jgi:phenylalanyl-tRNA synthetase beta chain
MKISLAWLGDYLGVDWKTIDVNHLVARFNQTTAEIEHFEKVSLDLTPLALARIDEIHESEVTITIAEWNLTHRLPSRNDTTAQQQVGALYLVFRSHEMTRWATTKDLQGDKDIILPAFHATNAQFEGAWKERVEVEDIILDVDNKSLTNRPDMWGHYGFAREVAAFMGFNYTPFHEISTNISERLSPRYNEPSTHNPFTISNEAPEACRRFSAAYFSSIENHPSNFLTATRLIRIGARPINSLVDLTNYVLYDLGQPMHAYDADEIAQHELTIRFARVGEKIDLLGEKAAELTVNDLVIADAEKPVCLAGIKGGAQGSVNEKTTKILLEAATFDAGTIRKAALRHKLRTDSSTRFEKTLDVERTSQAIKRFIFLAQAQGIKLMMAGDLVVLGSENEPVIIEVSHRFLTSRSGIMFTEADVLVPLKAMGFQIQITSDKLLNPADAVYKIIVPSFRASKEIRIKEDILEEVVRHYGFDRIPVVLPPLTKKPSTLTPNMRLRAIKRHLAFGAQMVEQLNYGYLDEQLLAKLAWPLDDAAEMINPVAENQRKLAPTLIPGLLNNVMENMVEYDELRFFEIGHCISATKHDIVEYNVVSGIFFKKRGAVDFYALKKHLSSLFDLCDLRDIVWKQVTETVAPWMRPYRTASLWYKDELLGYAGLVDDAMIKRIDGLDESSAFCFEIKLDPLLQTMLPRICEPLAKYQGSSFDLSCMIPRSCSVATLQNSLTAVDPTVTAVTLIDFYEKKEWAETRSLAFRLWVRHPDKTMTKEEIESVRQRAITALAAHGAVLRG